MRIIPHVLTIDSEGESESDQSLAVSAPALPSNVSDGHMTMVKIANYLLLLTCHRVQRPDWTDQV